MEKANTFSMPSQRTIMLEITMKVATAAPKNTAVSQFVADDHYISVRQSKQDCFLSFTLQKNATFLTVIKIPIIPPCS